MTTFNVVFSHAADADFDDILHYIAKDDPMQAIRFVDRLQQRTIDLLSTSPNAGTPIGKFRYSVFSGYVVVYAVDEQNRRVNVVLVSEGHRDWRKLLKERP